MSDISTKPYFLRAIYEWCIDSGFTPYISVKVDDTTRVPTEYVKSGEIVLNVSAQATRNLTMSNELIQFSARFNGMSREISIPIPRVAGIFARENGHGAFFQVEEGAQIASAQPLGLSPAQSPPPAPTQGGVLGGADVAPAASAEVKPMGASDKKPGRPKLTVIK